MTPSGRQKLIVLLTGCLVVMVMGLAVYFYVSIVDKGTPVIKDIHIDAKAALKIKGLEQVSKKNGITEWELKASSASYLKEENKAVLTDVRVVFYTEDQKKITLVSDQGTLDTTTHDMSFLENVRIRHETCSLKTDKLHYKKKTHIILSKSRVTLEDRASAIAADSMVIELNKNTITLNGNVKGTFSERFNLP